MALKSLTMSSIGGAAGTSSARSDSADECWSPLAALRSAGSSQTLPLEHEDSATAPVVHIGCCQMDTPVAGRAIAPLRDAAKYVNERETTIVLSCPCEPSGLRAC
eukprot:CAMPEP_0117611974 /NCGR_PEP_ID=MMETSP0784-20121206/82692_1 /TAXON_ID=39447 /ORGANISM="" /LENGTH=104 /DNA_ID=CAMNT_0005415479 /DNA_START=32 /DNA_END=343 /DNA_ORIENTATION=+